MLLSTLCTYKVSPSIGRSCFETFEMRLPLCIICHLQLMDIAEIRRQHGIVFRKTGFEKILLTHIGVITPVINTNSLGYIVNADADHHCCNQILF